jgi:hypothetical protein
MKQLLGRMYNDKQYLERLVEQAGKYNINHEAPFRYKHFHFNIISNSPGESTACQ